MICKACKHWHSSTMRCEVARRLREEKFRELREAQKQEETIELRIETKAAPTNRKEQMREEQSARMKAYWQKRKGL